MLPKKLPQSNNILSKNLRQEERAHISTVFTDRLFSYVNKFNLFAYHFNYIPNFVHEINIDCEKAHAWFIGQYEKEIKNCYFNKVYYDNNKEAEYDDVLYFMYEDLIVYFDTQQSRVRFLFRHTDIEIIDRLAKEIKLFKKSKRKDRPEISILIKGEKNIQTKKVSITRKEINIEENYNEDFKQIDHVIRRRLNRENDKGIILLHGKPGTGKTTYIRCLVSSIDKEVIFLPPSMAGSITNPDLINLLLDNPNSVFVIEDAENLVVDRKVEGESPVSAILNVSDGLLSDCLNIQIICSFNTDLSKIDKALLRKGRLIARYEFKELSQNKAQRLSEKLGFHTNIDQPMTLTSIYNQDELDFDDIRSKNVIGFRASNSATG